MLVYERIHRNSKRAAFDIAQCAPIKCVEACFVPALFVHGSGDVFITPQHSQVLFDRYASEDKVSRPLFFVSFISQHFCFKNRILVDGGHNSGRPAFLRDSASIFFSQCLQFEMGQNNSNSSNDFPYDSPNLFSRQPAFDIALQQQQQAEDDELALAIAQSLADAEQGNN